MVAEIFAASRSDVLAAMARSAQLETLEPAVVLLITKRDEAVSSQLEKDFVERLEKYVGESRVKVLFETRNDIVIERLLDFGRTERRYVFEGNGISLASSQEIRHEIEFLLRDEHGTYGVHQGGSYAGVDAFRRAFGALAERALVGR